MLGFDCCFYLGLATLVCDQLGGLDLVTLPWIVFVCYSCDWFTLVKVGVVRLLIFVICVVICLKWGGLQLFLLLVGVCAGSFEICAVAWCF